MGNLVVSGAQPGRVLLGRLQSGARGVGALEFLQPGSASPPLAAPPSYGVLVVGPSRSGKTSSVLMPAVRGWDGPVITTSIRDDVLRDSWEARKAAGWPVLIYNPKNIGGYGSNTWSPLIAAMGEKPWVGARRMASALIDAAGLAEDGANSNAAFWNMAAADFLGPLLLAGAQDGPSMAPVLRWLQEGDDAKPEVLGRLGAYPEAARAADAVWRLAAKQRDSIFLTARTALAAYQDADVLRTCLPSPGGSVTDITPDSVLGPARDSGAPGHGATLYIISPPTEWRYFAPLFTALITSLLDAVYDRASRGDIGGRTVLVALDEAANIAPIEDLPSIASTTAGAGIQLITVLQDLGQAERIWGREGARTLLQNHFARLVLGGTVDQPTLEWMQALLGEREVASRSHTGDGFFERRTTTRSTERLPVMSMAEIREMPIGTALLIAGSFPAALVSLRAGTTI
jgi:type IV secretory pathway TraG/TraD family ATPase VirD4